MDFLRVRAKQTKNGIEIYPDFRVIRSRDLMIRGGSFYAIWNPDKSLWSTDEYLASNLIDAKLLQKKSEVEKKTSRKVTVKFTNDFSSNAWTQFKIYMSKLGDNYIELDKTLVFRDDKTERETYASRKLPYALESGECVSYNKLMETLYTPEERHKLEWAVGSIIAGDSPRIQKFIVLYGDSGSGKSTFLNIVQRLFEGYSATFDAKALTGSSAFAFESLRSNPLVAIQHDVDLSAIETNAGLNAVVSHEEIVMNVKNKSTYPMRLSAMLFLASNKAVKITDAKSGIIRRLIDVRPSGQRVPELQYDVLMKRIGLELGAIAWHCLQVYKKAGPDYYGSYKPINMMFETDIMFNFVSYNAERFEQEPYVSLHQAYAMYKDYCTDSNIKHVLPKYKFREEMRLYFARFEQIYQPPTGPKVKDVYIGFLKHRLSPTIEYSEVSVNDEFLELSPAGSKSILKTVSPEAPAAYAGDNGIVAIDVANSPYTLGEIDETKTHFVMLPKDHIVVDIDMKDENGQKSLPRALEAAKEFPPTYVEVSNSGEALHLHYIYTGDITKLKNNYDKGIEIKKMVGHAALRRRLSLSNHHPITRLTGPLPVKERKQMIDAHIQSEKGLRELIERNLRKEIHAGTYPSVMFIEKILNDVHDSGLRYDITDMQQSILTFASKSTNHPRECLRIVSRLKWKSNHEDIDHKEKTFEEDTRELVFFDIEVYTNFNVIVYEFENSDNPIVLPNPKPNEVEALMRQKLIGFNNKGYDNHILWAIWLGHTPEEVHSISSDIINNGKRWYYREAVGISYLDVYDMISDKKSLKQLQIEYGLTHMELDIPWDKPISDKQIPQVITYCKNDVHTLKQILKIKQADYNARILLASFSGLPINASTSEHNARILFDDNLKPQNQFVYTDLSEMFPGYIFDGTTSMYRGIEVGEGGYVYAEPGMYLEDVRVFDVESMHPNSIIQLNLFGPYTERFKFLVDLRLALKHKDFDKAKELLKDKADLLTPENAADMAYALKIHAINSVYGMTKAKGGPFRDPRNVDNIVAKRGALFMIDLQLALQERGARVLHIKTDSVKLLKPTQEDIQFVYDFGAKYGYRFSDEGTYDHFCLVNKAVYVARYKGTGIWDAVGKEFQHPYVYKSLFDKRNPITWEDLAEIRTVTGASHMYIKKGENLLFMGRVGSFIPVKNDGGELLRYKDGKYTHVAGTVGYMWLPKNVVKELELEVDTSYYEKMLEEAIEHLSSFGSIDLFFSQEQ